MRTSPQLQSELTQRLLIGALREQDAAAAAEAASQRSAWLARCSRDLAMSLDEKSLCETIAGVRLPRPGSWSIVDILEADGSLHRLPVSHPDAAKISLAKQLEHCWTTAELEVPPQPSIATSLVLNSLSGEALLTAVHGESNLAILNEIGFGSLLVMPMVVHAHVLGAIMFVSPPGTDEFTNDETALAVDLAARCALALDNARLYKQADSLRVAAQQANQSKSEFLRAMSHELRTPLNAIAGFTELIEMGIQGPVTGEQRKSLDRIKANQEHLLGLITEILSFAQLESGRTTYENAEVVLPSSLASVADMLAETIREAGLTVSGPPADPTAVAWADPDRVRQIFVNLMTNAVKYGAVPGGMLTLQCAHTGETVTASVSDTGPGIPLEKLDTIFEPFVQLAPGDEKRRGGVGLGLAISRDLARGMDGELSVESVPGAGATFTLTLPRARRRFLRGEVSDRQVPPRAEPPRADEH